MEGHQQRAVQLEVTSKHAAGTYDFQTKNIHYDNGKIALFQKSNKD